jgi:hypothetical protein
VNLLIVDLAAVTRLAHPNAVELLPARPRSPEPTFSASAGMKPAQSLRICRDMSSISMDYFIARCPSH